MICLADAIIIGSILFDDDHSDDGDVSSHVVSRCWQLDVGLLVGVGPQVRCGLWKNGDGDADADDCDEGLLMVSMRMLHFDDRWT